MKYATLKGRTLSTIVRPTLFGLANVPALELCTVTSVSYSKKKRSLRERYHRSLQLAVVAVSREGFTVHVPERDLLPGVRE